MRFYETDRRLEKPRRREELPRFHCSPVPADGKDPLQTDRGLLGQRFPFPSILLIQCSSRTVNCEL